MQEIITSTKNPGIKHLIRLQQKSADRKEEGLFVVEGRRELQHCLDAGYSIDTLFVNNAMDVIHDLPTIAGSRMFRVSPEVYEKIAYRGSTEGVTAIVKSRCNGLSTLTLPADALIVVLEGVEKPGNVGAVLRSADAAGVDAVIICDPLTDLYNPNLIRASLGASFTVPCAVADTEECIAFLRKNHVAILTAQLQDSTLYYDTPMTSATAIIMGTEATGLTQRWRDVADAHIRIPMCGQLDSLNVSVSAAILMFEAVRQRQQHDLRNP